MSVPAAWRDYHLREWTAYVLFGCVIVSAAFAWSGRVTSDLAATSEYAFCGSLIGLVIAGIRLVAFRCPRCGHTYSVRRGPSPYPGREGSSRHCLHCWLPKWSDPHREYHDPWDDSDDW